MGYFTFTPLGTTLSSQKHSVPKLDFPDTDLTLILNKCSNFNLSPFPEKLPETVQETVELVPCPNPVLSQPPKASISDSSCPGSFLGRRRGKHHPRIHFSTSLCAPEISDSPINPKLWDWLLNWHTLKSERTILGKLQKNTLILFDFLRSQLQ